MRVGLGGGAYRLWRRHFLEHMGLRGGNLLNTWALEEATY
jgi:hypothetical protein